MSRAATTSLPIVEFEQTQPDFDASLAAHGQAPLRRVATRTLQVNVGKRCNQACHHCHVEAGPKRPEMMTAETAERILELLQASPSIEYVDITGGAPELNRSFRWLVEQSVEQGREVMDRCNLTVLLEPGMEDLPEFLARHRVHIVASLPCYSRDNVEAQRGKGVFSASIEALRRLGAMGYGKPGSGLRIDLVYNPVGAFLPPPQATLQADYKQRLYEDFGIEFNELLTITNMPIRRFADWLQRQGKHHEYMDLLAQNFNPGTVDGLMCRSLVSVGWDGSLYDCDFNQMLELPCGGRAGPRAKTIWELQSFEALDGDEVSTGPHCFGCTAGAGSSCGGALA